MSPPPVEYTNLPPPPSARPASLTAIGVIGIILAALGICCIGGALTISFVKNDPMMEHAPPAMMIGNIALTVMGLLLSLMLMIGSIGLLGLRSWSRNFMILWAAVDLLFDVVKLVVSLLFILPMMVKLLEDYPPPGFKPEIMGFVRIWSV